MILGMGLDIVDVKRMEKHCDDENFMRRFLHEREYEEIKKSKESPAMLLASRFAVKEAFGKATGIGLRGIALSDIQLDHDTLGRPILRLHGSAEQKATELGVNHIHVSITHEAQIAAAVVIFES